MFIGFHTNKARGICVCAVAYGQCARTALLAMLHKMATSTGASSEGGSKILSLLAAGGSTSPERMARLFQRYVHLTLSWPESDENRL